MRAERGSTIERCVDDQHVDCSRHEQTASLWYSRLLEPTYPWFQYSNSAACYRQSASSRTVPSEDEIVLPGWSC